MRKWLWWQNYQMIADTINYQNLIHRSESLIRPASMVSFLTHIIIIGIAVYGLPNFGRKLPPDLTVISFELLKVVEETNLDLAVKINPEKNIEIKENVATQDENTVDEPVIQIFNRKTTNWCFFITFSFVFR